MGLRDPISSISHLMVAVWAGFALLLMMKRTTASTSRRIGVAIFGSSMVLLYLSSGLFHGLPFSPTYQFEEFRFFQKLDQSAIFVLIAGTNTPLMMTFLKGKRAIAALVSMWGMALVGISSLWLMPKVSHELIVIVYVSMGWLGILPMRHYYRAVGWRAMNWIWLGCFLYTAGALCELTQWPVLTVSPFRFGYHEVLHILTSAASIVFFLFILRYVIPAGNMPIRIPAVKQNMVAETRQVRSLDRHSSSSLVN